MKKIIFVLGGCRSGKSRHALKLADQVSGQNKTFIATCVPRDEEMKQRVLYHKKERAPDWKTLEAPVLLPEAIIENSRKRGVILIDCLTLWVNNIFMENNGQENIDGHLTKLTRAFDEVRCPVILVSNEVGAGIVPENKLARQFRDIMGFVNQKVAEISDEVIWMVAGIPTIIKGTKA